MIECVTYEHAVQFCRGRDAAGTFSVRDRTRREAGIAGPAPESLQAAGLMMSVGEVMRTQVQPVSLHTSVSAVPGSARL